MRCRHFTLSLLLVVFASVPEVARGAEAAYHHVHLTVPKQKGIQFSREPWLLKNGPFSKASTVMSPDGVRVEIVQP
jgi:hypothetical protein